MNQTIIIFGGTGGIGGACARYFSNAGWNVILPVRNPMKPEARELATLPCARVIAGDPSNLEQTRSVLQQIKSEGFLPDMVFQATGTFLWDDGFPGPLFSGTPEEQRMQTEAILKPAYYQTKVNVDRALGEVFDARKIGLYLVSSHAASFGPDHPFRTGKYKQEAYCHVSKLIVDLGHSLEEKGKYRYVRVLETDLVDTPMTRRALTPERAGDIDWDSVQKPGDYIEKVFTGAEL